MTRAVDRKLRHVAVAEYRYRHEAEFAAGFLADAGIPYRLQIDDAGGADLGLSMLRPAVLWVRAVDEEAARDLVAWDEDSLDAETGLPAKTDPAEPRRPRGSRQAGLTMPERGVSGTLSVALLAGSRYVPDGPYHEWLVALSVAGGLLMLVAALVGRAPGSIEELVRTLAGSPPR